MTNRMILKAMRYLVLYGIGNKTISDVLEGSPEEAEKLIEKYNQEFSKIQQYHLEIQNEISSS